MFPEARKEREIGGTAVKREGGNDNAEFPQRNELRRGLSDAGDRVGNREDFSHAANSPVRDVRREFLVFTGC